MPFLPFLGVAGEGIAVSCEGDGLASVGQEVWSVSPSDASLAHASAPAPQSTSIQPGLRCLRSAARVDGFPSIVVMQGSEEHSLAERLHGRSVVHPVPCLADMIEQVGALAGTGSRVEIGGDTTSIARIESQFRTSSCAYFVHPRQWATGTRLPASTFTFKAQPWRRNMRL